MGVKLANVVPWGRSLAEYQAMFALSDAEIQHTRFLGCGDGPASVNAEITAQGGTIISVDPLYNFSAAQIRGRVEATYSVIVEQARQNAQDFIWQIFNSPEDLGRARLAAMEHFLTDYPADRYVCSSLPDLPFKAREFDVALCSHLLFLYSEQLSGEFHLAAIRELLRVAPEVRVFPLVDLNVTRSQHLDAVLAQARADGFTAELVTVDYEFQRGGNQMLRIQA